MGEKTFILTGRSLLTDGIVSKLAQSTHAIEIEVIDMCQPDPLKTIVDGTPAVLVVDQDDPEYCEKLKDRLLEALPIVRIIFLNPESPKFRVIQSIERKMTNLDDLLSEIEMKVTGDISSEKNLASASLVS